MHRASEAMSVLLVIALCAASASAEPQQFSFHHDDILGTSLDLTVWAPAREQAAAVEKAVLDEVERLRKNLSTHDADSEISRLNAATEPVKCSRELIAVLQAADGWRTRSGGAFNTQLGQVIDAWKQAEKAGSPPGEAALARLVKGIKDSSVRINLAEGTVQRAGPGRLDVGALAKGFIVDKALAAGKARGGTDVTGLMLNIGGDIGVSGSASGQAGSLSRWKIGVADPARSQDNAPPMTELLLLNRAVATSGHYERFYKIGDKRYSHIIDPRTGKPVEAVLSATVVAADVMTADALATALCVLAPDEGLKLVRSTPAAECLIVAADGRHHATPGFKVLEAPGSGRKQTGGSTDRPAAGTGKWPAGFKVDIALTLNRARKRPYVAVWIEDSAGKYVRTVEVWGPNPKWHPDLKAWWRASGGRRQSTRTVTKASRGPGQYRLLWDGTDDAGKPLAQGTYVVRVELSIEDGPTISNMAGRIDCKAAPAKGSIAANQYVQDIRISYGAN